MAEVTCVGIAFLDHVFEGDFELTGGGLAFAQDFNQYGGGTAATASVTVVRLGGFSTFLGRLGDDETGLRSSMASIDTEYRPTMCALSRAPSHRSLRSSSMPTANGIKQFCRTKLRCGCELAPVRQDRGYERHSRRPALA